jgi:hypothetical protein
LTPLIKRKLLRLLKRFFKGAGGFILFILLGAMELGDWMGIIPGLNQPSSFANLVGIPPQEEVTRRIILLILSSGIILFCIASAGGLLQRQPWTRRTAQLAAFFFILYGAYQIFGAFFMLHKNQLGVGSSGVVYILIGLATYGLGASAIEA